MQANVSNPDPNIAVLAKKTKSKITEPIPSKAITNANRYFNIEVIVFEGLLYKAKNVPLLDDSKNIITILLKNI
jgi:hypothetical protein